MNTLRKVLALKKPRNPTYQHLLKSIYKQLDEGYKNHTNTDYSQYRTIHDADSEYYKKVIEKNIHDHLTDNEYIHEEMKEYIKREKHSKVIAYKIPTKSSPISLNFVIYGSKQQQKKQIVEIDAYIVHILVAIDLIIMLTNDNSSECSVAGLTIFFYWTPFKREMPKKGEIIGAKHVNGGFCYGCTRSGTVVILRKEEWFKVFVHELIHNFGVDDYFFKLGNNIYKNGEIGDIGEIFNLNAEITAGKFNLGLQECVTEFWACLLKCAILSLKKPSVKKTLKRGVKRDKTLKKRKNNDERYISAFIKGFEQNLHLEITHSFIQSVKILEHNNLKYSDILSKTSPANNYRETSHVFSYYVLKLILLYNCAAFVEREFFEINNAKINICFIESLKHIFEFFKFLKAGAENRQFIADFAKIHKRVSTMRQQKRPTKTKYILENMRMTILDF